MPQMCPSRGRCQIWFWEVGGLIGGRGSSKRQAVAWHVPELWPRGRRAEAPAVDEGRWRTKGGQGQNHGTHPIFGSVRKEEPK